MFKNQFGQVPVQIKWGQMNYIRIIL